MGWFGNCIKKVCWLWELEDEAEGGGRGQSEVAMAAAEMVEAWKEMIVAICLSSAMAIATVSVQIEKKLPNAFNFLSLALLLCFGFVAFGKMTKSIFKRVVSQILYCMGGFLAVTALFIATAIPYAPYFQIIIFLIYLIFWLIFMFISHKAPSSTPL